MPRLLPRRRLHCHYCGGASPNNQQLWSSSRSWHCPHCEAVNWLDERGQITDPPVEATTFTPNLQYARSRSPTPAMAPAESPFCADCQRNQTIVQRAMAEYIPDEGDPTYNQRVASVDSHRADLEQTYPQVCDNCIGPVREQIRAAGYAAKADQLRRILEQSARNRARSHSPRQIWTLRFITLAKWAYIFSILGGILWHIFGAMIAPFADAHSDGHFSWAVCLSEAYSTYEVEQLCFNSSYIRSWVRYALLADLLTIWWNPQLEQKLARFGGQMRRLKSLWLARSVVLGLRVYSYSIWHDSAYENEAALGSFQLQHKVMIAVLILSTLVTWKTVQIQYQSTRSFMRSVDPYLPTAPNSAPGSAERPTQHRTIRPEQTTFDTMGAAFMSSFNANDDSQRLPPSPTLTNASIHTHATHMSTPYARQTPRRDDYDNDNMDWVPTGTRFGVEAPEILPPQFDRPASSPLPPQRGTHNIFAQPDPNPFHHRVPAAPKANIAGRPEPWKAKLWNPVVPGTQDKAYKDMMASAGSPTAREQFAQNIVPKNVQRDAEIFGPRRLKFDEWASPKTTGLEDTFNDLFSK